MMAVGDLLERPPSRAVGLGKSAGVTEWTIGDHGDAIAFAPWDHRVLDRALAQMVEHLVADRMACPSDPVDFDEIVNIEIADAPRQDLPLSAKPLEGGDRILGRMRSAPVQKIAIEAVGLEALERPLASGDRRIAGGIVRQHLGDEEDLVAGA
jgi:hypothetical protein